MNSLKSKNVVDRLASVGHTILDADHVEAVFNVLPEEYDTFIILVKVLTRALYC